MDETVSSDFFKSFSEKPVRESAGPRSSNRFDYQKNWSLCELLSLHASNKDYLMIFEHHEDVVVFDSESNPSKAIFYQVKSKSTGNWTIGALVKSASGDGKQSILGKLYSNYLLFKDSVESMVFTSNQGLSTKLKDNSKSITLNSVGFSKLSDIDKEKIHSAVELDGEEYCDLFGLEKISIDKTDLRLDDHTSITKGRLVEFFEKISPESSVNVSLVYKTFFDEIRRKTNYEKSCVDSQSIQDHKSISRSKFENMIGISLGRRNDNDLWRDANQALVGSGYTVLEIRKLRSFWQKYTVDKMNVENEYLFQLRQFISSEIIRVEENDIGSNIRDMTNEIIANVDKKIIEGYERIYVEAAILYEVMTDDPIPEINKKLTDEER